MIFLVIAFGVSISPSQRSRRRNHNHRNGTPEEEKFDNAARKVISGFAQLDSAIPNSVQSALHNVFKGMSGSYDRKSFISAFCDVIGRLHIFHRTLLFRARPNTPGCSAVKTIHEGLRGLRDLLKVEALFSSRDERLVFGDVVENGVSELDETEENWKKWESEKSGPILGFFDGRSVPSIFMKVKLSHKGRIYVDRMGCIYEDGSLGIRRRDGRVTHCDMPNNWRQLVEKKESIPFTDPRKSGTAGYIKIYETAVHAALFAERKY